MIEEISFITLHRTLKILQEISICIARNLYLKIPERETLVYIFSWKLSKNCQVVQLLSTTRMLLNGRQAHCSYCTLSHTELGKNCVRPLED